MDQSFFASSKESIVRSNRILYTPTPFARTSLVHLQEIGELTALKPHTSQRDNLDSFLYFRVISGSGALIYQGHTYRLNPGDCVFINCQSGYSHITTQDLWSLQWIHFNGSFLSNIYEKYLERGGRPVFRPKDIENYQKAWEQLFAIASSSDHIRDMKINESLNHFLTLFMSESWHPRKVLPSKGRTPKSKIDMLPVKQYLDAHFMEKITLDDIAEQFFISSAYMNRSFKARFGLSVTNYLLHIRITKAKQLLRFSEKTAEEIGMECGLGELSYFSRTFKKVEGIPPREYRDKWFT